MSTQDVTCPAPGGYGSLGSAEIPPLSPPLGDRDKQGRGVRVSPSLPAQQGFYSGEMECEAWLPKHPVATGPSGGFLPAGPSRGPMKTDRPSTFLTSAPLRGLWLLWGPRKSLGGCAFPSPGSRTAASSRALLPASSSGSQPSETDPGFGGHF